MKFLIVPVSLILLLMFGCSASTGSRYDKTEEKEDVKLADQEKFEELAAEENFDMTPFMEEFDIPEEPENIISTDKLDLWYNYETDTSSVDPAKEIVDQVDGFRVQVIATDDLEEANQIRTEIYERTNQKSVYIVFDPPFYKVKTGDFTEVSDARSLSFQLNQLGYKESRVVTEKVNIYK
jgi:hypothetical protein